MSDEEEVLEVELEQSPESAADLLRELADELEGSETLTIANDGHSETVELPTDSLEFEVELEREPEDDDHDEIELEIELEWLVSKADEDDEK
jgi:amphi-Trp domain-containing protein